MLFVNSGRNLRFLNEILNWVLHKCCNQITPLLLRPPNDALQFYPLLNKSEAMVWYALIGFQPLNKFHPY